MCVSPITLKRRFGNKYVESVVPCGKCPECKKKQQNDYTLRALEEAKKLGSMWFITLTYNDSSVPKSELVDFDTGEVVLVNSLCRDHIKKWKRDVRALYFKEFQRTFPKFSFLICGEYGPRTMRPHYHGVLFGLDKFHADYLSRYWQSHFGFTTFIPIQSVGKDVFNVARYVAKYCVKPDQFENPLVKEGIVEKPRKLTSVGFGLPKNFDSMKDYILNGNSLSAISVSPAQVSIIISRCKYSYNGFDYSLPIYLRKKLFYEVGLSKNLVSSPLGKLCSSVVRIRRIASDYRELRLLVSESQATFGDYSEVVSRFCEGQESVLESRRYCANEGFRRTYQSSKF